MATARKSNSGKRTPRRVVDSAGPERLCALTRQKRPTGELLRFVLSPEGEVVPDLRCKLPGRGMWLLASRAVIEDAQRKNVFARNFRQKTEFAGNLADAIYDLARIDALHRLSLANKAGLVITGYEKIKTALARGRVQWLLHASEAAHNGSDKLNRIIVSRGGAMEKTGGSAKRGAVLGALFTGEELSLALGRKNVIHIGLERGEMANRFALALQRAADFARPTAKPPTA